jgi:hypothetical protein
LGERLLCKQEVVGSIPSGSTNLRGSRRFGWRSQTLEPRRLPAEAFSEGGRASKNSFVKNLISALSANVRLRMSADGAQAI